MEPDNPQPEGLTAPGGGMLEWSLLADNILSPLGYEVLEAHLKGGKNRVLLVRIERKDEVPVTVSDLERANRALGARLDQLEALLPERYLLQVESPGAERPLYTARHFERFVGLKVRVRSPEGNFTGRVGMVKGDTVEFILENNQSRTLKLGTFKANLAEWPDKPR